MDDQFDKNLKDQISKVFDNYEDPSADEGWLKLREKFPGQKPNRRPIAWVWWSAAAVAIFLIGLGIWRYTANYTPGLTGIKKPKPGGHENLITAKPAPANTDKPQPAVVKNDASTFTNRVAINPFNTAKKTSPITVSNFNIQKPVITAIDTAGKKLIAANKVSSAENAAKQLAIAKTDSANNSIKQLAAVKSDKQPLKPMVVKRDTPDKSIATMFAQENTKKTKLADDKSGRVRLGIYAATYYNYARGSGNQGNVGGGASAEIKITKNLKLVTGIAVAQNSMNFNGGVPTSVAQSNFSVPGAATTMAAASAFSVKSAVTDASVPAFKGYGASLVNIDIPVNLKYEFNPKKNSVYVLAGLSSGAFINETYNYQYNYPALRSPSLQKIQSQTAHKSFDSYYFAKMLNFAFGVGHPLGKNNLILEPFIKYPLNGLGSQNIRFGSGGVNIKFTLPTMGK